MAAPPKGFDTYDLAWYRLLQALIEATPLVTLEEAMTDMHPLFLQHEVAKLLIPTKDACICAAQEFMKMAENELPSMEDGGKIRTIYGGTLKSWCAEFPPVAAVAVRPLFERDARMANGVASDDVMAVLKYHKLLIVSVQGLPKAYRYKGHAYRAVKWCFPTLELHSNVAFREHFRQGKKIAWYEPKSTSTSQEIAEDRIFCGHDGARTVFDVELIDAFHIEGFSELKNEKEVLVGMRSFFEVIASVPMMTICKESDSVNDVNSPKHHGAGPDIVILRQTDAGLRVSAEQVMEFEKRLDAQAKGIGDGAADYSFSISFSF